MDVPNIQEWMMLTVLMFRDQKSNHEIHENIVQWKFRTIGSPWHSVHMAIGRCQVTHEVCG